MAKGPAGTKPAQADKNPEDTFTTSLVSWPVDSQPALSNGNPSENMTKGQVIGPAGTKRVKPSSSLEELRLGLEGTKSAQLDKEQEEEVFHDSVPWPVDDKPVPSGTQPGWIVPDLAADKEAEDKDEDANNLVSWPVDDESDLSDKETAPYSVDIKPTPSWERLRPVLEGTKFADPNGDLVLWPIDIEPATADKKIGGKDALLDVEELEASPSTDEYFFVDDTTPDASVDAEVDDDDHNDNDDDAEFWVSHDTMSTVSIHSDAAHDGDSAAEEEKAKITELIRRQLTDWRRVNIIEADDEHAGSGALDSNSPPSFANAKDDRKEATLLSPGYVVPEGGEAYPPSGKNVTCAPRKAARVNFPNIKEIDVATAAREAPPEKTPGRPQEADASRSEQSTKLDEKGNDPSMRGPGMWAFNRKQMTFEEKRASEIKQEFVMQRQQLYANKATIPLHHQRTNVNLNPHHLNHVKPLLPSSSELCVTNLADQLKATTMMTKFAAEQSKQAPKPDGASKHSNFRTSPLPLLLLNGEGESLKPIRHGSPKFSEPLRAASHAPFPPVSGIFVYDKQKFSCWQEPPRGVPAQDAAPDQIKQAPKPGHLTNDSSRKSLEETIGNINKRMAHKEEIVAQKTQEEIARREARVAKREKKVAHREDEVANREKKMEEREEEAKEKELELELREEEVGEREGEAEQRKEDLEDREELNQREKEVEEKKEEVNQRVEDMKHMEREGQKVDRETVRRDEKMAGRERELRQRLMEISDWCRAVRERDEKVHLSVLEVERKEQELVRREEKQTNEHQEKANNIAYLKTSRISKEQDGYSHDEREYLMALQIRIPLKNFRSLVERRPDNCIVVYKGFHELVKGIFWQHIFRELRAYEAMSHGYNKYQLSPWIEDMVEKAIWSSINNCMIKGNTSQLGAEALEPRVESCLESQLGKVITEVRRHRRIEDFLVDLTCFEKRLGRTVQRPTDGEAFLSRIVPFIIARKDLFATIRPSAIPIGNARLVGKTCPTWTYGLLQKHAHLSIILGNNNEHVLETIGQFIAGIPSTYEAFELLFRWPGYGRDPLSKIRGDPASLRQIWYGNEKLYPYLADLQYLNKVPDATLNKVLQKLSVAEEEAVNALCAPFCRERSKSEAVSPN